MKVKLTEEQYSRLLTEGPASDIVQKVVWELIARKGNSKDYTDFGKDVLNKTFIGILHFTGSGLVRLYKKMGDSVTKKYFGKSVDTMIEEIEKYKMWGEAEDFEEYKKGWNDFLKSPISEKIQDDVAYEKFNNTLKSASNFTSLREIAIGISIINSSPRKFLELGKTNEWDSEKMIRDYCKHQCETQHNFRSRCRMINSLFPHQGGNNEYVFDATSCEDMEEKSIPTPFEKGGAYDQWMNIHPDSGEITHKKIKISEEQYNRLLTENTGDEWGRVSKTVDAFTIKVFKQIRDKIQNGGLKMNSDIVDYIVNSLVLTQEEAIILSHNFKVMVDFHREQDLDKLLGKPMEYMGVWEIPTHVPTVVELTGRGYPEGRVYVMGRTPQEALSTITHGAEEDFEVGDMNNLDLETVVKEFDIDIVDDIIPQKGMVQNDFYDDDFGDDIPGKFEVLPYIDGDTKKPQAFQNDLSRKKLNNLLKNIG